LKPGGSCRPGDEPEERVALPVYISGLIYDPEAEAPQLEDSRVVLRRTSLDFWQRNPISAGSGQQLKDPATLARA
jgi:hypothetical protein